MSPTAQFHPSGWRIAPIDARDADAVLRKLLRKSPQGHERHTTKLLLCPTAAGAAVDLPGRAREILIKLPPLGLVVIDLWKVRDLLTKSKGDSTPLVVDAVREDLQSGSPINSAILPMPSTRKVISRTDRQKCSKTIFRSKYSIFRNSFTRNYARSFFCPGGRHNLQRNCELLCPLIQASTLY